MSMSAPTAPPDADTVDALAVAGRKGDDVRYEIRERYIGQHGKADYDYQVWSDGKFIVAFEERIEAIGFVRRQERQTPCGRRAEWQIWDAPETPDGNTLACTEHVGALLTDGGASVVPYSGEGECCYIEVRQ